MVFLIVSDDIPQSHPLPIPRAPCLLKEKRTLVAETIGSECNKQPATDRTPRPSLPKALVGRAEPQAINLAKFSVKIDFSKSFLLCYFGAFTPGIRNDQLTKFYKLLTVLASLKFAMGALLATVHASLRITRTLPPTAIFLGGS